MKIQNALVSNILDRSQRYFAHVTTVTLSWRVQNIVVIGRVYFTLDCFEFSSNFEFDRNMLSGTGARSGHNYAHVTTAELSWHVQNCDLKGSSESCHKAKIIFTKFKLWDHKSLVKWAPLTQIWLARVTMSWYLINIYGHCQSRPHSIQITMPDDTWPRDLWCRLHLTEVMRRQTMGWIIRMPWQPFGTECYHVKQYRMLKLLVKSQWYCSMHCKEMVHLINSPITCHFEHYQRELMILCGISVQAMWASRNLGLRTDITIPLRQIQEGDLNCSHSEDTILNTHLHSTSTPPTPHPSSHLCLHYMHIL